MNRLMSSLPRPLQLLFARVFPASLSQTQPAVSSGRGASGDLLDGSAAGSGSNSAIPRSGSPRRFMQSMASHRQPMIKFPERDHIKLSYDPSAPPPLPVAASATPSTSSSISTTNTAAPASSRATTNSVISDLDLPAWLRRRPISEEEIEAINLGSAYTPYVPPKKKA